MLTEYHDLLDLHLKTLRDDSACPGVCKFIQYMKGCFDALDKKYVSEPVTSIHHSSTLIIK